MAGIPKRAQMLFNEGVSKYRFIFAPIALGLLLPALVIPWVVINILGVRVYSPIDIVVAFLYETENIEQRSRFDFGDLVSPYRDSLTSSVLSMILYIASLMGMGAAIPLKKHRPQIALLAGLVAVTASLLWFYSIDSLKNNFAQQAALTGGIIGEEFRGQEKTLADLIIRLGIGPYVALAGGMVGAMTFLGRKSGMKD